jgi:MFS family permease
MNLSRRIFSLSKLVRRRLQNIAWACGKPSKHTPKQSDGPFSWAVLSSWVRCLKPILDVSTHWFLAEGYDLALLGNLYASPVFNEKYGHWNEENKKYQVSAAWQSGLSNGARAGEIIGLIMAGWITDRYGSKKTTIVFLVMMMGTIFALFFAPNIQVLVAGEVLCGEYSQLFANFRS